MPEEAFKLCALANKLPRFRRVEFGIKIRPFKLAKINLIDGQQPFISVSNGRIGQEWMRRKRFIVLYYLSEVLLKLALINFPKPAHQSDGTLVAILELDAFKRFHRCFEQIGELRRDL